MSESTETTQPQKTKLEVLLDSPALKAVYTSVLNGELTHDEFVKVVYAIVD